MWCGKTFNIAMSLALGWLMCAAAPDAVAQAPPEPEMRPQEQGEPGAPGRMGRGRGHRPRGWRHGHQSYDSLSVEARADLWEFMGEHFPDLAQELADLEQNATEAFAWKMRRMLPRMLELIRLQDDDPEAFPLRVKELGASKRIRTLARQLARVPAADRDPSKLKNLRKLVAQRFDIRQQLHRLELKRLEHRLVNARQRLEQAKTDKAKRVDEELENILSGTGDCSHRPRPPLGPPPGRLGKPKPE